MTSGGWQAAEPRGGSVQPDLAGRLAALRAEFQKGRDAMADLQREQQELQERMLRIAGAIEVLEELISGEG